MSYLFSGAVGIRCPSDRHAGLANQGSHYSLPSAPIPRSTLSSNTITP